jgi:hypothetical protein
MRGAILMDFAFILTFLFLLMFLIMDFGRYYYVQHTLQFATREGVRLALVGRTIQDENGVPLGRLDSILRTIRSKASAAVRPGDLEISVYPVNEDFSDPRGWESMQDAGRPGSYMRVRTRYTFQCAMPMVSSLLLGGSIHMQTRATYRNELFND